MNAKEKQKAFDTFMSLLAGKQEVFHSPEGEPFIRAVVNGHGENYPLKKKGLFEDWCRHLYFVGTDVALPQVIFNMMLEQLQAEARFPASALPALTRNAPSSRAGVGRGHSRHLSLP